VANEKDLGRSTDARIEPVTGIEALVAIPRLWDRVWVITADGESRTRRNYELLYCVGKAN
jgi:hypothetical protein